ncbi:MAG: hypothetical protein QOG80_970 [Pseudonocardiales bacterium]|nr:hypothetical protein [Pseudonocardiales bacterium]
MLDVAIRRLDGSTAVELGGRAAPPLPVAPALAPILPDGLRRGSTVSVTGSIFLLLALLGEASAAGAWCALVGFPHISAEAAHEHGIDLTRVAVVPPAGIAGSNWSTAVGALLDAVDLVAARPPRLVPGDVRRLAARARTRDAVLVPYLTGGESWPGADVRLAARGGHWTGIGTGTGRLVARRLEVTADGRGQAARPRSATLWLPASGGGTAGVEARPDAAPVQVIELAG